MFMLGSQLGSRPIRAAKTDLKHPTAKFNACRHINWTFAHGCLYNARVNFRSISLPTDSHCSPLLLLLRYGIIRLLLVVAAAGLPLTVYGHGGVVLEDDICLIKVGFYEAHFTIFQPRSQGHEQFCEDLPDLGESVFVLEYLHDGLEDLMVDFRVIRNTTSMGLFASAEDLEKVEDWEAITEFYKPPVQEPDVVAVLHQFDEPGAFIGVVTATDPASNASYMAVFPFEVGYFGVNYPLIAFSSVFLTLFAFVLLGMRQRRRAGRIAMAITPWVMAGCLLPTNAFGAVAPTYHAEGDFFHISATPEVESLDINRMHKWRITVTDRQGHAVSGASIEIEGGMPEHDHGLATNPRMTAERAPGEYLIEGMKFHMNGYWEIILSIRTPAASEVVKFDLTI